MNKNQINRAFMKLVSYNVLDVDELRIIFKKIKIDKEKKCWFYKEDWSMYATYRKQLLHRLMFRIFKEEIKGKNFICHHCDRPGCVNPDHLYQGTAKDNFQDAIKRGRYARSKINHHMNPLELDRLAKLDSIKRLERFAGESDADWNRLKRRF